MPLPPAGVVPLPTAPLRPVPLAQPVPAQP
jgi:hypothetical protein